MDVYEEVRRVVIDLYYEQKKQILLKTGDGEADKGEEDGKVEDDKKYEGILEELQQNAELIADEDHADEFVLKLTAIHDDWGKKRAGKRAKEAKDKKEAEKNRENMGAQERARVDE